MSLRSEDVRVHPGMPFDFASESAFGFVGILTGIPTFKEAACAAAEVNGITLNRTGSATAWIIGPVQIVRPVVERSVLALECLGE